MLCSDEKDALVVRNLEYVDEVSGWAEALALIGCQYLIRLLLFLEIR